MPISDASGLKKTPYTFTIKNTCNADSKTKISLNVLNSSTMDSSIIKFSMKYGSLANSTPVLLNTFNKGESSTNVKESYLVKEDIIRGNEEKTYSIYLWMDESAGNEYMNKTFNAKVSVTSEAIEDTPKYMAETITDLASKDTADFADDDPDNNIRYIGKDPSNYVYFNCSDYNNQSDSTCEKWRIIGVFKNVTKEDGSQEDLVKIIRGDKLSDSFFYWDYKKNGVGTSTTDYGSNEWTDSQLMMMLNPTDYLKSGYIIDNNVVKDSKGQAIYQNMGSYYNGTQGCKPAAVASGTDFTCASIDFTSTGLKNDSTRNAIESVVWNLGGSSTYNDVTSSMFYERERGTTVYSGHATTWTGKIGLMYPSDYGYATAGGTTTNRATCLAKEIFNWDDSGVSDCKNNDYLYKQDHSQWALTHSARVQSSIFYVNISGNVSSYGYAYGGRDLMPTTFLKSNISITSGDGSSSNPYQLSLN